MRRVDLLKEVTSGTRIIGDLRLVQQNHNVLAQKLVANAVRFFDKMACSSIMLGPLFVGVILTSIPCLVLSIPRSQFYTFGVSAGDSVIPSNDDRSSPRITLQGGFFPYFGQDHTTLYVSYQL